ncbi:hypothetical protein GGF43_000446 [Coemansia sp. RSA 2618]|nr:hypothetical protein GGF43_000446 [Coemansia sp. RSA 2618]
MSSDAIAEVMRSVKGGVLVKNGKVTSCEIAITAIGRGLMGTDCVDFTSTGAVDPHSTYEAYIDTGMDGKAGRYNITRLSVMSNFKADSVQNNYMDIDLAWTSTVPWRAILSPVLTYEWDAVLFVRRSLDDVQRMRWDAPQVALGSVADDEACSSMSGVFRRNPGFLMCNSMMARVSVDGRSSCDIPYGTVYGVAGVQTFLLGLYSYSMVDADGGCNKGQRNYYTALYKYVNNAVYNWGVDYYAEPSAFVNTTSVLDRDYLMRAGDEDSADVRVERGDFFRDQTGGKGTRTKGVIAGVCVAAAGVLVISVVTGYWWVRRKRSPNVADPVTRNHLQEMLEDGLNGGVGPQHVPACAEFESPDYHVLYDPPPKYDDNIVPPPAVRSDIHW